MPHVYMHCLLKANNLKQASKVLTGAMVHVLTCLACAVSLRQSKAKPLTWDILGSSRAFRMPA